MELVIAALIIGLLSTLHCLGMCGGIMGALTFSLPPRIQTHRLQLWSYLSLYNVGRITSYAAVGALFGHLGGSLHQFLAPAGAGALMPLLAALLMTGIGFYLAGWFPKFAYLERIGEPLWHRLEPVGRRLLPVTTPLQALLYGVIWGWLPCGLVYSSLLLAATTGTAAGGALVMAAFGLGTLPSTLGAGILTNRLGRLTRHSRVRQIAGVSLILVAMVALLAGNGFHMHEEQQTTTVVVPK